MEYLQTRSSLESKGASIESQIQMQQFYGDPSNEIEVIFAKYFNWLIISGQGFDFIPHENTRKPKVFSCFQGA